MQKFTIALLAMLLIITGLPQGVMLLRAEVKNTVICETESYKIEFKVNSQWDTGMEGQVIITNIGSEPIENWRLKLNFMHEITSLWDGEIESHHDSDYVIKYPAWNPVIRSGGKAVIGFNAKINGNIDEIKGRLNKERSKIARDAFVDYIKKNQETYFFPVT